MRLYQQYLAYLLRWQLSTPLFVVILMLLDSCGDYWLKVGLANLVGGLIFFWVDRMIFNKRPSEIAGEMAAKEVSENYKELKELVLKQNEERKELLIEMKKGLEARKNVEVPR